MTEVMEGADIRQRRGYADLEPDAKRRESRTHDSTR